MYLPSVHTTSEVVQSEEKLEYDAQPQPRVQPQPQLGAGGVTHVPALITNAGIAKGELIFP
jgi:hypothetical protein